MFNLFNFLRLRRQAPTNRPPKGYFDLRISKANGKLVLVDEDGTEAPIAITSQADGTITSADITDATSDGSATNKGKVLKTDEDGYLTVLRLITAAGGLVNAAKLTAFDDGEAITVGTSESTISSTNVVTERAWHLPDADGTFALQAANQAAISQADGSDAASTQALANVLKADVNTLLAAMKASKAMAAD